MTPPRPVTPPSRESGYGPGRAQSAGLPPLEEEWEQQGQRWLPRGWVVDSRSEGVFGPLFDLADRVAQQGACSLPGVNIKFDNFVWCMWRAVARGFVRRADALFVQRGLREGFTAGARRCALQGVRVFRNYPSADVDHREKVAEATADRVREGKTLRLGAWREGLKGLLADTFTDAFVFPLGAVLKALEWWKARPTDDHTRTGFNDATDMSLLWHRVTSYDDLAAWLRMGFVTHVSDVEAAFPQLPFAPHIWPFMFHRFCDVGGQDLQLFCHLNCDFGTRGLPGTFKIFFVDVLLQMARSELLLTRPMMVHVDDTGLIGSAVKSTVREMRALQAWSADFLGVGFKALKDRAAAHVNYVIGFWWDSFSGTRTLDETKLMT